MDGKSKFKFVDELGRESVLKDVDMEGIFHFEEKLFTKNLTPGISVYGEHIIFEDNIEYREWDPRRSKPSAYILVGGRDLPFRSRSRVLYLGAASGTTVSHISDICTSGQIICVETSRLTLRKLMSILFFHP